MRQELFCSNLERNFADDDNRRFDNELWLKKEQRKLFWFKFKVSCGIVLSMLAASYIIGVAIFSAI